MFAVTMPSPSDSGHGRSPSPPAPEARRIVVAHRLPLRAEPNPDAPHGFDFSLDPDALPLQLSHGLPGPVVFVGALPPAAAESVPASDELAADLLERFSCHPVFLPAKLHADFYDGFCKHYMWPMLHYLLPLSPSYGSGSGHPYDGELYRAFLTANTQFADRVFEVLNPAEDFVFIHDYHLWALPTILRHKSPHARIGFFLHSPFPTSELFRAMPVREDLLRSLLNADLVGFHTFDYARHFLSSCTRILGIASHISRGYIGIEYYGRTVVVKILSVGVDMDQLRAVLPSPETAAKAKEIADKYKGRQLMLGVDDMDLFKGIALKLLAMEKLLDSRSELRGNVVLVQINNPPRSLGRDIDEISAEVLAIRDRINARFGLPGYEPVVVINGVIPMYEKVAFYTSADICIVNAVRDGLNRTPYFYTVCREEGPVVNCLAGEQRQSAIIVSEFVGCSPSLSGAIRVNPWNVDGVAEAMNSALRMKELERQLRQEKHYKYVSTHDVAYWARSFDQDLQRACKDHSSMVIVNVGLAMSFRVVALGPNFQKLLPEHINPAYRQTGNRLILLDNDGTVMPQELINKAPSQEVIRTLNELCSDPKNTVFLVSGRGKDELAQWFAPCEKLGIAAEHGYFTRWSRDSPWESCKLVIDIDWKNIAEPVMKHYTDATDGSSIEVKETSLVWHYEEADPDFGSCQAKELQDHLQSVLANEPVYVKSGHQIVEVNPQGVGKGIAVEKLVSAMGDHGNFPDFILCVGDDRSDEAMFEATTTGMNELAETIKIFPCTVGNKPSLAKYYLDEPADVLKMLQGLAQLSTPPPAAPQSHLTQLASPPPAASQSQGLMDLNNDVFMRIDNLLLPDEAISLRLVCRESMARLPYLLDCSGCPLLLTFCTTEKILLGLYNPLSAQLTHLTGVGISIDMKNAELLSSHQEWILLGCGDELYMLNLMNGVARVIPLPPKQGCHYSLMSLRVEGYDRVHIFGITTPNKYTVFVGEFMNDAWVEYFFESNPAFLLSLISNPVCLGDRYYCLSLDGTIGFYMNAAWETFQMPDARAYDLSLAHLTLVQGHMIALLLGSRKSLAVVLDADHQTWIGVPCLQRVSLFSGTRQTKAWAVQNDLFQNKVILPRFKSKPAASEGSLVKWQDRWFVRSRESRGSERPSGDNNILVSDYSSVNNMEDQHPYRFGPGASLWISLVPDSRVLAI